MIGPHAAHARSVQLTVDAVSAVSPGQLTLKTPCSEWNLTQLLDHMTVQNLGFAAAANGAGADDALWATGAHRDDPTADYLASAAAVSDAFAPADVLDRQLWLPELSREQAFSGAQAITMHTVDSVLHAWDVARSIGRNLDPDPELVEFTLGIGHQVPDGDDRRQPGAHFGPRAQIPAGASAWDQTLALFGRSPDWSA
ncbi:TIGR03086 family metal-binding protein [Jiangella gansuensis]|uniref:TIGR03086 family metal-binding protein n=1 Tax=Jiangella gansuensis TaxID=281473 RepID=UPI00047B3FE7|nr:TIGR03086 family metal-binding protein [Jiangella gansuensis]